MDPNSQINEILNNVLVLDEDDSLLSKIKKIPLVHTIGLKRNKQKKISWPIDLKKKTKTYLNLGT